MLELEKYVCRACSQ